MDESKAISTFAAQFLGVMDIAAVRALMFIGLVPLF